MYTFAKNLDQYLKDGIIQHFNYGYSKKDTIQSILIYRISKYSVEFTVENIKLINLILNLIEISDNIFLDLKSRIISDMQNSIIIKENINLIMQEKRYNPELINYIKYLNLNIPTLIQPSCYYEDKLPLLPFCTKCWDYCSEH